MNNDDDVNGLNLAEIEEILAKNAGISKAAAKRALASVTEAIKNTVAAGGSAKIAGFGVFKPALRAERTARNPATGEALTVKAARRPKFVPAKAFKDLVDKGA